nr:MAG TPA: hypothetical protein [Caudoviricetes sp.]
MKMNQELIVLRRKETGSFLKSFEDRGTLAYQADYTDNLANALFMSLEKYEEDKMQFKNMAKTFGCEVVKVKAEYKLTYPNGSEVREIKIQPDKLTRDFLRGLLD